MKALYYDAFGGPIRVRKLDRPQCPDHGVLVKVKATGICRSDWHGWQGHDKDITLPHVPGHEFAGEIAEIGADVTEFAIGDRVTTPFVCGCGNCCYCAAGNSQICPQQSQPGFTHWGSFAEFVTVYNADFNLVRLPEEIDFVTAASLGCRYGTAFRAVVDQGRLQAGELLGVLGCGGVGLAAIQIGHALGARILACDVRDDKLALAQKLGAEYTLNLSQEEFSPAIIKGMSGGLHLTLDAFGDGQLIEQAMLALRPGGRHVQVGLVPDGRASIPIGRVISHELELLGSHGIPSARYSAVLQMVIQGQLNPRQLVSGIISLEQSPRILQGLDERPPLGMVVVDMDM